MTEAHTSEFNLREALACWRCHLAKCILDMTAEERQEHGVIQDSYRAASQGR